MLNCITNSGILRSSLEFVSKDDYDNIIKDEFKTMCTRFGLNDIQMIRLVTTLDISLLVNHYNTIWDGLNYYSMACMDDYKTAYIETLYKTDLMDLRIETLCDDLQEYIKCNSCINSNKNKCDTFKDACKIHHDVCVKYLLNNSQKKSIKNGFEYSNVIEYLCACGCSLDIIKYLFEIQNKDCSNYAIDWACMYGHLDVIAYLFETQNKDCSNEAMNIACKGGHLDVVKYLFEIQNKDCTSNAVDVACEMGHLDVVKYLFEIQKKDCTTNAIDHASMNGHLDVVKYLFEIQNKDCTSNAIDVACEGGHLDVVKYLFETQNKDCTSNAINWACSNGHLDVVAYLIEIQKKDCIENAINCASQNGHLHIVKYLSEMQNKK